jgi:predicted P-loop ATPase
MALFQLQGQGASQQETGYATELTPEHRRHLLDEGFSEAQIDSIILDYRVRSLTNTEALQMGFKVWDGQEWRSSAGILLPFAEGFAQMRCDTPLERQKGKPAKYLTPVGTPTKAHIPKNCQVVTEGFKDAVAGILHGGIPTGAIAGVSHSRKALPQGCGYTIIFDADGWRNPQVFASLIHAGKWINGQVALLPEIDGHPHAGLCEYFKAGNTAKDYQSLIDSALKPEDLLQQWPEHWEGVEPYKIVKLARMATCLSVLYLTLEESTAYVRRVADRHQSAGLRARELATFAKKWRDRRQKNQNLTTYQREHRLISNKFGRRLAFNELTLHPELDGVPFKAEKVKAVLSLDHGVPLKSSREDLIDSILKVSQTKPYHPVRDYLESVWNHRNPKLEPLTVLSSLAKNYFDNNDPTAQTLIRKTLISAVARVLKPGCKVDTATVLAGPQGYGKSQFWKTLASVDWFCDDFNDVDNKDHLLKLHEAWIIEWPELHGLTRKEANRVKSFMTTARDRIRRPYGREAEWMARPSILVGTSNDREFLTDSTGNRRWWIIEVAQKIDIEKLKAERDQIWAAAVALYKEDEPWWLSETEELAAETTRKQYEAVDAWHDAIAFYLENKEQVSIAELFQQVLNIDTGRQDNTIKSRVTNVLRRCGWESAPNAVMHQLKRQRVWKPKNILVLGLSQTAVPAVPPCYEVQKQDRESTSAQHTPGTPTVLTTVSEKSFTQRGIERSWHSDTAGTAKSQSAQNKIFSPGDQVKKKGKTGWVGTVKSDPASGWVEVLWQGDKKSDSVQVQQLEAIA